MERLFEATEKQVVRIDGSENGVSRCSVGGPRSSLFLS